MRSMILCLVSSVLAGCAGCASIQRPDAFLYGVNAKAKKLRGYNLRTDYNEDGTRKPDAVPKEYRIESLDDINGWTCASPVAREKILVWIGDLRDAYAQEKERCGK